jgi:dCTP deaminase
MSIKADRWMIKKSLTPSHISTRGTGFFWQGVDFFEGSAPDGHTVNEIRPITAVDLDMFLKQNPWFPMIAPFLPEQEAFTERPLTDLEKIEYYNDDQHVFPGGVVIKRVVDGAMQLFMRQKVISSGVSSYGYDVKCADEFKIFTNINSKTIDPKNFDPKIFVDHKGPQCIIPPNSFVLARTAEWFKIPRNVLTVCLGKSTYARCGIIVNVTPLEPEWEGHVTLEFSNTTTLPAVIYANEGVAQMLFFESDEECLTSYKDRGGKYQGQSGVNVPRMK